MAPCELRHALSLFKMGIEQIYFARLRMRGLLQV